MKIFFFFFYRYEYRLYRYRNRLFEEGENTLLNCKAGVSQPPRVVKNGEPRYEFVCTKNKNKSYDSL